ncbi:cyclohexanone monooxygenase, partial [Dissoconium aciculare CBS 342.82]|uniref:Cyclohexanone monooxygenase n=1 Tax=Dissoconium aciculare CBS 342.82 TaxID=1314786 RepID=A0A6J3M1W3_9PEZI
WQSNRYPGCRCDLPGPTYQFTWRYNVWSEFYPAAAEIQKYLSDVARENDFYKYIKFKHEVIGASWTDEEVKWTLSILDHASGETIQDKVDLFLEFNGPVSDPRINVAGIENFKGPILHPGEWDAGSDLKGKRVALIGYGSTGVQIAPYLLKDAAKLYTWHRNKNYIGPPHSASLAGENGVNFAYNQTQKELLEDPDIYLAYRKQVDEVAYKGLTGLVNGSQVSELGKKAAVSHMQQKLKSRPDILECILPTDFEMSCRRPTFDYGYLDAITSPKSEFLLQSPKGFTESGLIDADGVEHEIDVVVAATGYNQSFIPRYPKLVNGVDMREKFREWNSPPSYMSMSLDGMPNYFNPSLAYAPLMASYFLISTPRTRYIVKVIDKMQREQILSLTPKRKAIEHWIAHCNAFVERMPQGGPCVAWYKSAAGGAKAALWPGGRTHYMRVLENPRFEDFDLTYVDESDIFSYLGNGYDVEYEGNPGADNEWYLGPTKKIVPEETLEKLRGVYGTPVIPGR